MNNPFFSDDFRDGVWAKHAGNPVIRDLYGGDPFLVKLGEWFHPWHSEAMAGSLRIVCRRRRDMVNWERVGHHPRQRPPGQRRAAGRDRADQRRAVSGLGAAPGSRRFLDA